VALDVPDGKRVCDELIRRQFIVDYRPQAGIRVSPHFYSTEEECLAVVDETRAILRSMGHG
jgi:kynureninase